MAPKTKASPTGAPCKALATQASVIAYCAAEYRARIGTTWSGGAHLGAGWADGSREDSPLADALDVLRAAAVKVARLATGVAEDHDEAPVASFAAQILASGALAWRLPDAPALRKVIARNVGTFYTRKLTNYELALISILCGTSPNINRDDTVDDVVKREADAMRKVRLRTPSTRTTRTP